MGVVSQISDSLECVKKKKKKEVGTGVVQHKATAGAAVCESQQSF